MVAAAVTLDELLPLKAHAICGIEWHITAVKKLIKAPAKVHAQHNLISHISDFIIKPNAKLCD